VHVWLEVSWSVVCQDKAPTDQHSANKLSSNLEIGGTAYQTQRQRIYYVHQAAGSIFEPDASYPFSS
jgi:hypothetical protein